jgi:hypothetical protein
VETTGAPSRLLLTSSADSRGQVRPRLRIEDSTVIGERDARRAWSQPEKLVGRVQRPLDALQEPRASSSSLALARSPAAPRLLYRALAPSSFRCAPADGNAGKSICLTVKTASGSSAHPRLRASRLRCRRRRRRRRRPRTFMPTPAPSPPPPPPLGIIPPTHVRATQPREALPPLLLSWPTSPAAAPACPPPRSTTDAAVASAATAAATDSEGRDFFRPRPIDFLRLWQDYF